MVGSKPAQKGAAMTAHLFELMCDAHDLPRPTPEYRFAAPRRFRFDYCWKEQKIALEVQGGLFTGGRHVRGAALLKEHEKLNEACIRGYRVLFCTPQDVKTGAVFALIKRAIKGV